MQNLLPKKVKIIYRNGHISLSTCKFPDDNLVIKRHEKLILVDTLYMYILGTKVVCDKMLSK